MFVGQHTTWGCGPHLANGCKTKTAIYIYMYIYIYRIPPLIYGRYGLYMDYKPLTKRHVHPSILTWQSKYHGISFQYLVGGFKHFLFSIIYGIILPID